MAKTVVEFLLSLLLLTLIGAVTTAAFVLNRGPAPLRNSESEA